MALFNEGAAQAAAPTAPAQHSNGFLHPPAALQRCRLWKKRSCSATRQARATISSSRPSSEQQSCLLSQTESGLLYAIMPGSSSFYDSVNNNSPSTFGRTQVEAGAIARSTHVVARSAPAPTTSISRTGAKKVVSSCMCSLHQVQRAHARGYYFFRSRSRDRGSWCWCVPHHCVCRRAIAPASIRKSKDLIEEY